MKYKATVCGSISTVFFSTVLQCVSSIIIKKIIIIPCLVIIRTFVLRIVHEMNPFIANEILYFNHFNCDGLCLFEIIKGKVK